MRLGRLKSRRQFLEITKTGHKAVTGSFVVFCRFDFVEQQRASFHSFDCLYGLTVTKKNGIAVVRNRMKRRLRAMIRDLQDEFQPLQTAGLVFIARYRLADTAYDDLCDEGRKVIRYLNRQRRKSS